MKFLILITLLISFHALAVPVLNKNMAAEGTLVTIWPDNANPDHFYFAPNLMKIASDKTGAPKFHFTQYKSGSCNRRRDYRTGRCQFKALITSLLEAGYESKQLIEAQEGILKLRPNARFSSIPFVSSRVEFATTLSEFIDTHDCSPKAGQAADQIPCNITLNKKGITNLMPFLNAGRVLPFKFIYQIAGVIEGASGEFIKETLDYGLTVNLGGEMLNKHPDLNEAFLWEQD